MNQVSSKLSDPHIKLNGANFAPIKSKNHITGYGEMVRVKPT